MHAFLNDHLGGIKLAALLVGCSYLPQVRDRKVQHETMVEAVQNHNPDVS